MIFGLLLVSTVCAVNSINSEFGPRGLCQCDQMKTMNCSDNKHLQLNDVCDFINISVTVLYLERNGYNTIRERDMTGCWSLKSLFLGHNEISSVDKFSFTNFGLLRMLDLSFNQLDVYNKSGLLPFRLPVTLEILQLNGNLNKSKNDIALYPDLSNLIGLKELYLDGLTDINFPESYSAMSALQAVSLSGLNGICDIPYVSNFTFENIPMLRSLNLSSCDIKVIDAASFKNLRNLETLDLSQNLNLGFRILRNVSYSLQFTEIRKLNLSRLYTTFGMGTQLKLGDVCYLWNTSLTEVDLSSNRIEYVQTNFFMLIPDTLKILRAEDNRFTFGPYSLQFACLSSVEEVYGNYQNLQHEPTLYEKEPKQKVHDDTVLHCTFAEKSFLIARSKIKKCPYIEDDKINMTYNLPTIPKSLKRVEVVNCDLQYYLLNIPVLPIPFNMTYIDVSSNILYSWIGPIGPFPHLKYLNLSRNFCTHIGLKFFDGFRNVEDLQLQGNFLGLVLSKDHGSFVFDMLENVKVLNLSSNIISFLHPRVFSKMSMLTKLDLSINNIESLNFDDDSLNNLTHLNLKLNFISSIPSNLRKKLELNAKRQRTRFTVDLSNNTLTLSCDQKEFLKWIVKHKKNMVNFDQYVFRDKNLRSLSAEQFVIRIKNLDKECRSYVVIIVLCSIGIAVFLSIVLGGVVYKNRWKLRYLMRINNIKYFGYNRLHQHLNEPDVFMYDAFISYANENVRFILDKIIPKLEEHDMKLW